jgi:hypothetical protein
MCAPLVEAGEFGLSSAHGMSSCSIAIFAGVSV